MIEVVLEWLRLNVIFVVGLDFFKCILSAGCRRNGQRDFRFVRLWTIVQMSSPQLPETAIAAVVSSVAFFFNIVHLPQLNIIRSN